MPDEPMGPAEPVSPYEPYEPTDPPTRPGRGRARAGTNVSGAAQHRARASAGPWAELMVEALHQAALRGSRTIEAEHVLLAITVAGTSDTRALLADAGIDNERLARALKEERRAALARIGFRDLDETVLVATPHTERIDRPMWGTSIREAMARARRVGSGRSRSGRGPSDADFVLGILLANLGTVPRALELAGIDRDTLIGRIQRARTG